jgi:hypothetical protein
MTVDVTWDGVALAKGATIREQDGGFFVEMEQPMPVGTSVTLSGDVQATVAVTRVHEGIGAGMLLRKADARPPSGETEVVEKEEKKEKRKKKR